MSQDKSATGYTAGKTRPIHLTVQVAILAAGCEGTTGAMKKEDLGAVVLV